MSRPELKNLIFSTFQKWSDHNAPRLGASLAFYMLLSMAPLMIMLVTICGLVFSEETARQAILVQVREMAGSAGERTVGMLMQNAAQPKSGVLPTIVATVTLLLGASGVFLELRDSLNTIWEVPKRKGSAIQAMVWQRLVSFGMVLAVGLLLVVSLLLSAALTVAENFFFGLIPVNVALLSEIANFLVPLVAISGLFALIFKFLPEVPVAWRDVVVGAFATAVMFSIGKAVLAYYLGTVGVGSTYGAAGSLVAFVVWVYYSAQIFFFGAEFTKNYADCFGTLSHRDVSGGPQVTKRADILTRGQGA